MFQIQVTRQKNTTLYLVLLLFLLVASSGWLFGLAWTLILCALGGLSYCATAYICYRPEARGWKDSLSEWYEHLFMRGLGYSHTQSPPLQRTHKSSNDQTPLKNNAQLGHELQTKAEASSGFPLSDERPLHLQAEEQVKEESAETQPGKMCHKESQKIIQLIMKEFIFPWYSGVTSDTEFPEDIQKILEHIALEVNVRIQQVDYQEAVVELLELILPYLEVLNEAGSRKMSGHEVFDVTSEMCVKQFEANPRVAHYAMKSAQHEKRHYRQALDALIQCAFPPEYAKCDVACMLVREILVSNLIEPLFNLLCDPAFLYEAIPLILAKATKEKVVRQLEDIKLENEDLDYKLNRGRLMNITGSQGRSSRRFFTSSGRFGQSTYYSGLPSPDLINRRGRGSNNRAQSVVVLPYMQRTSSGIYESNSRLTQSMRARSRYSTIEEGTPTQETSPPPTMSPKKLSGPSWHDPRGTTGANRSLYQQQHSIIDEDDFSEEESGESVECLEHMIDGDYAVVQLSPIYIERHVRVEDPGAGKTYVAYIFKFPKWMLPDADLKELGVIESDTHLEGIKRFSQFTKFHDNLLASPQSAHIKGLQLPEKRHFSSILSKLPFTSSEPDTTVIMERKQGLEKYLQSVSSVEPVIVSDLFIRFLKSAVKDLKEANVVSSGRSKKQNRMSFLGRVRGEDSQKAEPIPKRPLESVLSSYLNTHLPLPCQLNSLNSIRSSQFPPSNGTPTKNTTEPPRKQRISSVSSLKKCGSAYSLSSIGSAGANSVGSASSSINRNHSFEVDSFHPFEHPSTTVLPGFEASHLAVEAVYDTASINTVDGAESSTHSSRQRSLFNGEEEEEGCTIGSVSVPSSSSLQAHKLSLPHARKLSLPHNAPMGEEHPSQVSSHTHAQASNPVALSRLQSFLYKFLVYTHRLITWLIFIIQKSLEPFPKESALALMAVERQRSPLTNILFSLGSEVSVRPCPRLWACAQNTQLSLLVLAGGGLERYLWKEMKLLLCDEVSWTRALYSLRHTLWPGGVLIKSGRKKPSELELDELKRKAANAVKRFLPNFLPTIVGPAGYDAAVVHCLDCLRNQRLNRHFLLRVVDLLVVKIVPEITDKDFQKHLSQLRTIQPLHSSTAQLITK